MSSTSSTTIVAGYAKSGKSSCKKCSEKIDSKSLRLGLKSWDPRGYDNIKWHHFNCFSFLDPVSVSSVDTIQGFSELTDSDQDKLMKMASKGDQSSAKTDEYEEAGLKKKVTEEKVVAKYAKSGKSSCKKCFEKIESKSLRLGLRSWDLRGFENTKWHHVVCFFTLDKDPISPESIEGFLELKSKDKEKLKKLVIEWGQSSKKREGDEEAETDKRDLRKLETDEDGEPGKKNKATKEKIVAKYAKSGKSSCKKCFEKIESKSLRLGLRSTDPGGFENTKWHHVVCFFTLDEDLISPESVEGFLELKSNDQEKLKKLITEAGQSSKKREGDKETEPDKRDLRKLKTDDDEEAGQEKKIVAEYAKSGKSSCKKCSEKIEFKSLRMGLSSWDRRGFEYTKWHHLDCFFTLDKDPVSPESIEGFLELKSDDQEKLKKLATERGQSTKKGYLLTEQLPLITDYKREGVEETELDRRDLKKLKTDEDEEAGHEKKVTNGKIVTEYAKSGKSSCKKCYENIESKSLRMGLSSWARRGFEYTKWYHLDCFFTLEKDPISLESIQGFLELKSNDQEKLKKLVIDGGQSSKKRERLEETELGRRDLKKLKSDEEKESWQNRKVTKEKIVAKYAKSGKSSCKKCFEKFESKSLRLGLRSWDSRGFENIKWHHLDCFFTLDEDPITSESIEGFLKLKSNDQEKLKKLVTEVGQSSKKRGGDKETEIDKRDLKKLKTDEDEEGGQEKKIVAEYAKSGKSSCKKCSKKIDFKYLRLGLSGWDSRGFEYTKWHHLDCFFTLDKDPISPESIEGFLELKSDDQEKLKKLVTEGGKSSRKTDEDEEAGHEKKIVAEYAKSGKSSCKKCSEKIESKSLRMGLSSWARRGFEYTKWHHLDCFFTLDKDPISPESIEGFLELKSNDQEKLKKLVTEGGQSSKKSNDQQNLKKLVTEGFQASKKREEDEQTEPDRRNLKKLKTDEDVEAGLKKKVTKEKIVAEYAKSGKSSCKKCYEKIEFKSLRLGLSSWDRRGFEYTKWHHLDCFITLDKDPISQESIEGFLELKSNDQEKVKKMVTDGGQSYKEVLAFYNLLL